MGNRPAPRPAASDALHAIVVVATLLIALPIHRASAQRIPGTDVYLAGLEITDRSPGGIAVASPENITHRAGYDNQPAFMGDARAVFYTSIREDGQADIYRFDIATKNITRVTTTPESEYSPTLMPGGRRMSVVRVEADSTQRLWSTALDGTDPALVLGTIKPVGYHAWLDATHVALYVLGTPSALLVVDTKTERADTVARDIDRSLAPMAVDTISFVQRRPDGTLILSRLALDGATGAARVSPIAPLPAGAVYAAWTPTGVAITAAGSRLYTLRPGEAAWREAADLAPDGLAHISRLAISPDGHWIALVADDAGEEEHTGWHAGDEVVYQIFVRSFRDSNGDRIGDLRGIQDELGYLQDLGVTSLLLTPINPSPTYHNYFASSFEGVDPAYGDAKAFHDLVEAVHARHMKIYLDEEIQYAVGANPWLRESLANPGSRFSHYILYDGSGNTKPEPIVYGISALPTYDGARIPVATVNLLDTAVVRYFQDLFASLVDPNHDGRFDDGVDGFRLDHMMDDLDGKPRLNGLFAHFWAPIFARARAVNPRVRFIAEQADWGFGDDWLVRGGVDLVFAFPLQRAISSLDRDSIAHVIAETLERTPKGKGQLIFIENHDMSRFASVHPDPARQRIGAALGILLEGTPLIYYGQEIGMKGMQSHAWNSDANDIPDREAFKWTRRVEDPGSAIWYRNTGPWWTDRYNRDDDGISVEEENRDPESLLSYYRRLLALRRSRPELRTGDERVIATDQSAVLAVLRAAGDPQGSEASLLLVNLSGEPVTTMVGDAALPLMLRGRSLKDLLRGGSIVSTKPGLRVALPPYGVRVLGP